MTFDKVVNSARLDGAMTATANAIRMKNGSTDQITWDPDKGFESAISTLETGGGNTLLWEGDISGRRVIEDPSSGIINYYRISGEIPTVDELSRGIVYTQTFSDGRTYVVTSFDKTEITGDLNYITVTEHQDVLHINMVTEGKITNVQPYYIIAKKNDAYDSDIKVTFPESGIYIIYFGSTTVTIENPTRKLTIYGYTKFSAVIPPMEEITVTPSDVVQNLTPQTGYQGFLSVKVEPALGGNAIKWDGNRTGVAYTDMYHLVSQLPLPIGDDIVYIMTLTQSGMSVTFENQGYISVETGICAIPLDMGDGALLAVIIVTDDAATEGSTLAKGTYFLCIPTEDEGDAYISSCAIKGFTSLPDTVPILQTMVLTPDENTDPFVLPDEGYDGMSAVVFEEGGTLIPENIREGVTILGVTGTYTGE